MHKKIYKLMSFLIAVCVIYSPSHAQNKTGDGGQKDYTPESNLIENWTEEEGLEYLDEMATWGDDGAGVESTCPEPLTSLAKLAASLKSEKLLQKVIAFPEKEAFNREYPQYAYDITVTKVNAMRGLKDFPMAQEFVIQSLGHESRRVQIAAASVLLSWGEEWDKVSSTLCKYEEYYEFQQHKDDRAIPILESAAKNGSWKGRFCASAALFYTYGDSATFPDVVLDVILNAPINDDNEEVDWAIYSALRQVPVFNLVSALPGILRLINSNNPGIRSMAVGHLVHLSKIGYGDATNTLIDVRDNHPDAHLREQAQKGLEDR